MTRTYTRRTTEQVLADELADKVVALPYELQLRFAETMQRNAPQTAAMLAQKLQAPVPCAPGVIHRIPAAELPFDSNRPSDR